MDLTSLLVRAAAARPHVLVAAMPGATAVRLAAEDQLRRRGWPAALTPADTDILLVAGLPAPDIAGAVEAAWAAVPAPRARARAVYAGDVATALDDARAELAAAVPRRRADTTPSGTAPDERHVPGNPEAMSSTDHGHPAKHMHPMDHDAPIVPGPHDTHGGQHGHDMSDMGMEMPGGLPMADRGQDRDGLTLDQLHVPLGPLLPDWPAGLVIRLTLQGDVIQHAEAMAIGLAAEPASFWTEPWRRAAAGEPVTTATAARWRAAAYLDSLARFLSVAGWDAAAASARALRDEALGDGPAPGLELAMRRLARRVARSRVLAWSTRGTGLLLSGGGVAPGTGIPALAASDATARYRGWCHELSTAAAAFGDASPLDPAVLPPPRGGPDGMRALLAALPRLLEGAEFAAARLIVASLDPDLGALASPVGAGHGH